VFVYAGGMPEGLFILILDRDVKSTMPGSSMWTALDNVLSTFSSLRTVRFKVSQHQYGPLSFVDYVKRGLSSCHARGLLSFEHIGKSKSNQTCTRNLPFTPVLYRGLHATAFSPNFLEWGG
jgi:hypothetical protein